MFVRITDPDKAMELYRAGLLWDSYRDEPPTPASGWYTEVGEDAGLRSGIRIHLECDAPLRTFYILLED